MRVIWRSGGPRKILLNWMTLIRTPHHYESVTAAGGKKEAIQTGPLRLPYDSLTAPLRLPYSSLTAPF